MKKKNILQIFASRTWGGGEQYVFDLSDKLINNGYKVFFVGKKSPVIKEKIKGLGKLFTLPLKGIIDLYSPFKLRCIIKKNDIDIVHIHQFKDAFTTMLAKLITKKKFKVVLTRHLVKKGKTSFLYTKAYQSIDKVVFVSELAKITFLYTNPNVDINKIEIIHNSVRAIKQEETPNHNYRQNFNINPNDVILMFTGRIVGEKGLEVLLNALTKLRSQNYMLLIAGSGEKLYVDNLKKITTSLNIDSKAIFLGFVENIADLINQGDIGIMPSVWQEPFGLAALEYMRAGKPVITTNNGAQKEFIENGVTGILVPPNDTDALAVELDKLIANLQLREQIGDNAKKYFESDLNYDKFFNKIIKIYAEL